MPGAPFSDIYAQIWEHYQAGRHSMAREIFSRLMLMVNLDQVIPGTRQYIMRKRGVFKTSVSRQKDIQLTAEAMKEIDFNFEALKPYLRA